MKQQWQTSEEHRGAPAVFNTAGEWKPVYGAAILTLNPTMFL
jgi:hypothetical protein